MSVTRRVDIYTARELARAAGVPVTHVEAVIATGELPSIQYRFITHADAVAWGRGVRRAGGFLLAGALSPLPVTGAETPPAGGMFEMHGTGSRHPAMPAAVSMV